MTHIIENTKARIERNKDKRVRRIYVELIKQHIPMVKAYDTAHSKVYYTGTIGKRWTRLEYLIASILAFGALC